MPFRFARTQVYPAGQGIPKTELLSAMLSLMLGVSMSSLDTAIANTALPTIAHDLGTTEAMSVWVVSSYQLAMAACLLPLAGLGEIIGHRRVIMAGLILFSLASLLCGVSSSLEWLVVARVLQGIGGAALMSVNAAMVRFVFPANQLGRGIGINSLVVGVSFAAGPTIASLILSLGSWHWLFWVNVPTGVLAIWLGLRSLPATPRSEQRFDHVAGVLCSVFFALLIFTLNEAAHGAGWGPIGGEAVLTVIFLIGLLRRQKGMTAPVLAVDLLRRPLFALSSLTGMCSFATQSLAFVSLPFLLQHMLGYSQIETGFLITPWSVIVALAAPIAGRLSDRYSSAMLCGVGLALLCIGMVSLALLPAHPSVPDVVWRMLLCGAGFGFFQSPNLHAIMTSAPPERSGGASGMVGTVRLVGQSSGAAMVAACFHVSNVEGAWTALWLGAAFAGVASLVSFMRLQYR
ncbi:MAG TPA: MFS transporter [Rhodocyclaceae bacterium]|jgi:DHA2 family multidrug resistance protein-like MFS transporter|nr:MFS transporter [Rhodocyclaceae bacterium]